jgi:uncharacterized protein
MEALLRNRKPAAEIMRVYAAEDAERGRNEACSCGSGRKFKRCHGDRPLPTPQEVEAAIRVVS